MKICKKCNKELPKTEYYTSYMGKSGPILHAVCKKCSKKRSVKWTKNNKESRRRHQLKYYYGITLTEYNKLLELQNGTCAICQRPPIPGCRRLAVDHNHVTKKVRGLLCPGCNQGIGHLKDNPDRLRSAIKYLEKSCA